jgi:hypothetical protein
MPSPDVAVSVIAVLAGEPPARVEAMVASAAAQDWPGAIELVVAAPAADHGAIRPVLASWGRGPVVLLTNADGSRTRGLNACLQHANGPVVVRVDARSRLSVDHVSRCVARLDGDCRVAVVGAHQIATAPRRGVRADGIARALRHPALLGGAPYRRPDAAGPVDTVYLGTFRRDEIRAVGYAEELVANEDFDLCARLRARGRLVWLEPGLDVDYESRATYRSLLAQYLAFGRSKVAFWRARGARPRGRQLLALALTAVTAAVVVTMLFARPWLVPVVGLLVVVGYVVADARGERTSAPVWTRLTAVAAHVVIEAGWVAGVVAGFADRRRNTVGSGDVEHPLERDAGLLGGGVVDDDAVHHLAAHE